MPGSLVSLLMCREAGLRRCPQQQNVDLELAAWAEADFLHHASSQYANLQRAPRSTIAAAFSCDGQVVASTQ